MNLANIFLPKGTSLEINGIEVVLLGDTVVQTNPYTVGPLYNPLPDDAPPAAVEPITDSVIS